MTVDASSDAWLERRPGVPSRAAVGSGIPCVLVDRRVTLQGGIHAWFCNADSAPRRTVYVAPQHCSGRGSTSHSRGGSGWRFALHVRQWGGRVLHQDVLLRHRRRGRGLRRPVHPGLAKQAIAFLREQTDNPITYLVLTHPNPDKFNGAPAFQEEGATVVSSEATEAAIPGVHEYKKAGFVGMGMFTEETYPQQATVDETFSGAHTLELEGGKTVELSELSEPGVSSTQTVAFIPELNALIVGDLVHHKLHAWLEGGIVEGQATPTIEGWIADLHELETTFAGNPEPTVYGGRGEPAPLSEAVADQIAYLEKADQIVTDYVAVSAKEVRVEWPGCWKHYAAIQAELERAFPDYAFPDMISFSVYGLVNSKL